MGNLFSCPPAEKKEEIKPLKKEESIENKQMPIINILEMSEEDKMLVAAESGDALIIDELSKKGVSVNCKNKNGETPMHLCAKGGHVDAMRLLDSLKADAQAIDNKGNNPMHLAAQYGKDKAIELLAKLNVKVDVRNGKKDKNMALHLAAIGGHEEAVEMLFKMGATDYEDDWNAKFQSPLEAARASNQTALVNNWSEIKQRGLAGRSKEVALVADRVAKEREMFAAVQAGDVAKIQSLSEEGVSVSCRNKVEVVPLFMAATMGNVAVMKLLVKLGAGSDVNSRDRDNETPLFGSCGRIEAMKYLISLGADVNAVSNSGVTPMHCAACSRLNSETAIELLFKYGANDTVKTFSTSATKELHNKTPLEFAQHFRCKDLVANWNDIKKRGLEARVKLLEEKKDLTEKEKNEI